MFLLGLFQPLQILLCKSDQAKGHPLAEIQTGFLVAEPVFCFVQRKSDGWLSAALVRVSVMWTTETKSPLSPDFLNTMRCWWCFHSVRDRQQGARWFAHSSARFLVHPDSVLISAFTKTGFHYTWDRRSCGLHSAQVCPTDTEFAGLWGSLLLVANKALSGSSLPLAAFAGARCHAELVRTANSSCSSEDGSALCREAWQKTQPAEPDQHVSQIPYKWEEVIKPAVKH